ncbi:MAG: ABC transporter permease [Anaerolineaceae bacterium]|nr:ABC transporter permease [Anaerolineaceae bacterium]
MPPRSLIRFLPIGWIGRFVLLRLAAKWRSMLTAIFGVLLVAIIGANAPLYTSAITQVGMVQRLNQQPPETVQILSRVSLAASQTDNLDAAWSADDVALRAQIDRILQAELPGWVAEVVSYARTTWMWVVVDGVSLDARMAVAYYDNWEQALQLVEGEWPQDPPRGDVDLEVALGAAAAARLNLHVNDEIVLDQRGWESSVPLRVRITAIVRDNAAVEPYLRVPAPLRIGASNQAALEANLLTTRTAFLQTAADYVPDAASELGWWVLFDHTQLLFPQIPQALTVLDRFASATASALTNRSNLIYRTQLPAVLQVYQAETRLTSTPFEMLLLQISVLALFFLMTTASLIRQGERRETAMLQTRGTFDRQIVVLRGLEALIICLVAALLAPLLARWILEWIFPALTGLEQVPLELNLRVLAYSGLAAGVACLVLLATLYPILRLPPVAGGGSTRRSDKQVWWQQYNLDLVLLFVGIIALWRFATQAEHVSGTQIGTYKPDVLLLLAPVLLFVALGSLLLRLFPVVTGLLAKFLVRRSRLEGLLATWQVSREPAHYGRITFLLVLSVSIGWMATSFQASLEQNHMDQSLYQVGADLRIEEQDAALRVSRVRPPAFYTQIPGVAAATTATRIFKTNVSNDPYESIPGIILAVDSNTLAQTAYWRKDLGELKLPPLPGALDALPVPGRAFPVIPERIGLWVRLDVGEFTETGEIAYPSYPNLFEWHMQPAVRLHDATGALINVPLRPVDPRQVRDNWVYLEGDLRSAAPSYVPQGELHLDAVYWSFTPPWYNRYLSNNFIMSFDGLSLIAPDQSVISLDWFAQDDQWEIVHDTSVEIEGTVSAIQDTAPTGDHYRQVSWTLLASDNKMGMGILLNYPDIGPIPAISSNAFASLNGLLSGAVFQVGQIKDTVPWFELVDTIEYYPTLYADQRAFLIVNQDALLYTLNRLPTTTVYATEAWLRLEPGTTTDAAITSLEQQGEGITLKNVRTLDQTLTELQSDLLSSVGLSGMLYLAFGVALALSVISLLAYLMLAMQLRRVEFGVLQALGLSSFQIIAAIAFEQMLVMGIAVGLGTILGIAMSDQVLPVLALSANGQLITPPFAIHAEPATLLDYSAVMLGVLFLILTVSLVMIRRMSLAQSLRFGEE